MCRLYTQEEQKVIREFKSKNGHECYYCSKQIGDKELITVDHLTPYSRGGLTNPANLVIACEKCNKEKSDMTKTEYIDYLKTKENLIKNNEILKQLISMMSSSNDLLIEFKTSSELLKHKINEKRDIEKCITSMKFNASEGYMLCKDMKNILIEIDNIDKKTNRLKKLQGMAESQKTKLKNAYDELVEEIVKDLRHEMNIGKLALKSA
jgi:hypothetical protein